MTREELTLRYTEIRHVGVGCYQIYFKVGNQYFRVFETDEGLNHAVWFVQMLVTAIENLIAEQK